LDAGLFIIISNSISEINAISRDKSDLFNKQIEIDKTLKEANELIEIQNNELSKLNNSMIILASGSVDVKYVTENGDKFPIYNELSNSFNDFVDLQYNIVNFANSIAQGNFKNKLDARNENDILVKSINTIKDILLGIVEDVDGVSKNLSLGKLYSRLNENNLYGSYKDLTNNMNGALDVVVNFFNVNSNLMIANAERSITFINNPLMEVIKSYESDFRKSFPSFNSNTLIGTSIDGFHQKPEYNKGILNNLSRAHGALISVGDKRFNLVINPIKDRNGKTLCFIVNWIDTTSQVNFNNGLAKLTSELNEGKLDYRLNSKEQIGEYIDLSNSINEMIENVIEPLLTTSTYLDRISKGDIPSAISKEYSGDYDIIKNNINKLIVTMNLLVSELQNMSKEHDLGDIDIYAQENLFEGAFKTVINQTNEMVRAHINVKRQAINVFNEFGNGNFNADMAILPGKKIFINNTINSVRNNLVNFNQEMVQLVDAAQRGELSFRADNNSFEGGWSMMVNALNELLDKIVTPINAAGEVLSDLAQGDLTNRIDGNFGGDFEKLKNNINFLADSLDQVLTKVNESVQTTASTTHQLTAAAANMASAAQEQSSQTDDVASAVEEMSRTITDNASNSTRTAEVAEQNGQIAFKGGKAVEDTVSKMKDIAMVVKNTSTSIEKLGSSSQAIGEIISVIDDIADQTNLLALNAAIEAARAGEQGRGFAVVADEVRKLAERTSDATKQIAKMIKGIQQETQDAVLVMQTGTKEVENGIKLADDAGNSLRLIVSSSQELINMITQISAASEQQSATSEEISKNVNSISKVISESARQIEDIAESSDNLSQQTVLLTELMSQFKLTNGTQMLQNTRKNLKSNNNYLSN
jgi:methyl-accepting chemotaxis protein